MVYSFTSAPPENFSVTTEDRNARRSLVNHDKVTCITYSGYEPGSTTNSLTISKVTLRVIEFEERQGD